MKRANAPTDPLRPPLRRLVPAAVLAAALAALAPAAALAGGTTYYVSSSTGSDLDDGLSPASAFETVAKVNSLSLGPGDEVRFRCGDLWRGEILRPKDSGAPGQPITLTSDPPGCAIRPVLTGAEGVVGWSLDAGNVWVADLSAGGNAGRFPFGINQLFRAGARLPFGRWPNPGAPGGGYSTIDSQPVPSQIVDAQLPAGDWTGAIVHHKSERWLLFAREVVADSGSTLTLNEAAVCRVGCASWGYFLNRHRATLDREGEWYYDAATNRVFLYTTGGAPPSFAVEGSVLPDPATDVRNQTGIIVGGDVDQDVDHVVIDNFEVRHWAGNGIQHASPLRADQNHSITLRNNRVRDVGQVGIRLASFLFQAAAGPNGWRGGTEGVVTGNVIDGANLHGIETYSVDTLIEGNQIVNVAVLDNLVADGMGCGLTGTACGINGNGVRIKVDAEGWSGEGNTVRLNRMAEIGMNGVDVFGPFNLIERNVFDRVTVTLGEGAGVRVSGGPSFAASPAHDIVVRDNVVRDAVGNSDGCSVPQDLHHAWGHGVYVDRFSDRIDVVGNTVVGAAAYGFQFNRSRGTATDNTFFDNATGTSGGPHTRLINAAAEVEVSRNVFYGKVFNRPLVSIDSVSNVTAADLNYYFNPRDDRPVKVRDISNNPMTLADWQVLSGFDLNAVETFYTLDPGDPELAEIFINDTAAAVNLSLGGTYLDLDQNPVAGSIALGPFESRVLIRDGSVVSIFADGFESGGTSAWSAAVP